MSDIRKMPSRKHQLSVKSQKGKKKKKKISGCGLINSAINKLPFELHYPRYNFLGPGTKLQKRLARGDQGVNKLDEAAKRHDIFYNQHKDTKSRHIADKVLEEEAWERVKAPDSNLSEKVAAYITTNAMKVKRFLGAGLGIKKTVIKKRGKAKKGKGMKRGPRKTNRKMKKVSFSSIVKMAKNGIKMNRKKKISKMNDMDLLNLTQKALKAIHIGKKVTKFNKSIPRIIPIPKTGGVLPLIPILAGLASISTIASNAPSIVKTIKNIIGSRKGQTGSGIGSCVGNGLFLAPYKKGYGLFLRPPPPPPPPTSHSKNL